MIVVSDTSPLNYLVLLGVEHVLPKLFGEVFVPPAVLAELARSETPVLVRRWASQPPDWLRLRAPASIMAGLDLDLGETEAISLFIELKADSLLIDDRKGRRAAAVRGLTTIGTLTMLEIAAQNGLVSLPVMIERLSCTNFRASRSMLDEALKRDAARRGRGQ
jgi:predicted nucleic acid-binding protein